MEKKEETIVCRCEELTEQKVRDTIRRFNLRTANEVKRLTRAGMGLCQGRTCEPLIKRIMAEETNRKVSEMLPLTKRPPTRPINIKFLAEEGEGEVE